MTPLPPPPTSSPALNFVFKRWRRQLHASAEDLRYRITVRLWRLPAHVCNLAAAAQILGPGCANLVVESEADTGNNLSSMTIIVQALFEASVTVAVGSGESTLFWRDKWLDGQCMSSLAPDLLLLVNKRAVKTRTVAQALQSNSWVADITGSLSALAMLQYLALWESLEAFRRRKWTASGQYSASSAYRSCINSLFAFLLHCIRPYSF
jgi:hypothetical protein